MWEPPFRLLCHSDEAESAFGAGDCTSAFRGMHALTRAGHGAWTMPQAPPANDGSESAELVIQADRVTPDALRPRARGAEVDADGRIHVVAQAAARGPCTERAEALEDQ